jgi:beta-galactosidase
MQSPRLPFLALTVALLRFVTALAAADGCSRPVLSLADDWSFHRGPMPAAERDDYDDRDWSTVSVPHTWNAADGEDGGGNYYRGEGWYRRRFRVEPDWRERRVYLEFDGANRVAEVFLNGRRLGEHRGGYARFRFDVTAALDFARENVLAVRVDNGAQDDVAPLLGDFTLFGGMHRAVRLFATDRVQIDPLDHASPGVFVIPVSVTAACAEYDVRVELASHELHPLAAVARVTICDAIGQTVQTAQTTIELPAQGKAEATQRLVLPQPRLWDGLRDPYLYRVRAELLVDGKIRDAVEQPLGVRFFAIDPARGFSLNGRPLELRGANRHQDRARLGSAIGEQEEREDLAIMLEMGCNTVRTAHYQHSASWYDLADRHGVVLWTEIPLVYDVLDNPGLFENCRTQLRELIRQNYNHPSILFWGVGNETFVRDTTVTPADTNDRLLADLARVAREEDATRLSVYASNGDVTERRATHTDAVGFNHYFGWYHDRPEDFAAWLDRQRALRPDLKIGMSEYGAGANPAQHEDPPQTPEPGGPWHPEEWQAHLHEVHWRALATRPWVWCKLVWCMFDIASDGRNEGGTPGINDKGLVTADRRIRKDAFYWYKANWSSEPVLHITSRRFTPRTQPVATVKVYSNAASVELVLNGVSCGRKTTTDRIFLWPDVALTPGENLVEARASFGVKGEDVRADRCVWVHTPEPVRE